MTRMEIPRTGGGSDSLPLDNLLRLKIHKMIAKVDTPALQPALVARKPLSLLSSVLYCITTPFLQLVPLAFVFLVLAVNDTVKRIAVELDPWIIIRRRTVSWTMYQDVLFAAQSLPAILEV